MPQVKVDDDQPTVLRVSANPASRTRRTTDASLRPHRRADSGKPIPHANSLLVLEAMLPLIVLGFVVVTVNRDEMPSGLGAFLELRITVKNALIGLALLVGSGLSLVASHAYVTSGVRWFRDELIRVGAASTCSMLIALLFPLTSRGGGVHVAHVHAAWAVLLACEVMIRGARRFSFRRQRETAICRVLVVGTGSEAVTTWRQFISDDNTKYDLVGFVDLNAAGVVEQRDRRLGSLQDLERLLMQKTIDEVFVALSLREHYSEFEHVIGLCERLGIRTKYGADIVPTTIAVPRLERGARSIVTMNVAPDDYRLAIKRTVDVIGALAALIVLSPVMLLAALAVKLTSPGPVFFSQERCGLNRRPFRMIKFRTMVANAGELQRSLEAKNEAVGPVFKIAHDPRITAVGRFLRKTSIDELPQLINVLRGEMSLVGPRPLPTRDVKRFRRGTDMRRFSVTPGLTCLWQVSGRSSVGFGEWVQLDLQYIDGWSLQQDLEILVRTVPAVIRGDGAM